MFDIERFIPMLVEIFAHKSPVTVVRRGLRTEKTSPFEVILGETALDLSLRQQV
jgi:hypothetical protein